MTESTGVFGNKTKTQKIVEKVTDYYWKYSVHYEVILFKGNNTDVKVCCLLFCVADAGTYFTPLISPIFPCPFCRFILPSDHIMTEIRR